MSLCSEETCWTQAVPRWGTCKAFICLITTRPSFSQLNSFHLTVSTWKRCLADWRFPFCFTLLSVWLTLGMPTQMFLTSKSSGSWAGDGGAGIVVESLGSSPWRTSVGGTREPMSQYLRAAPLTHTCIVHALSAHCVVEVLCFSAVVCGHLLKKKHCETFEKQPLDLYLLFDLVKLYL